MGGGRGVGREWGGSENKGNISNSSSKVNTSATLERMLPLVSLVSFWSCLVHVV